MTWRSTAGVLVLVAILGAAFWVGRQAGWATRTGGDGEGAALVRLIEGATPTSIEIQRTPAEGLEPDPPVRLRRTPTGWEQEAPVWYPLAPAAAAELVGLLEGAVGEPVPDASPADYALDPPIARLIVGTSAGAEEVRLGEELLDGGGYAWSPAAGTVLLNGALHNVVLHTPVADLRRSTLPLPPAASIAVVSVTDPAPGRSSFVLRRRPGGWVVDERGAKAAADAAAVRQALDQATSPVVARFVQAVEPEDGGEASRTTRRVRGRQDRGGSSRSFGLEPGDRDRVLLAFGREADADARPFRVVLGRPADLRGGTRFARVVDPDGQETPVLQVHQAPLSPLLAGRPDLFRLRRVVPAALDEVRAVTVTRGDATETFEVGPGRGVPGWLAGLLNAEAAEFLPGFALDDPPVAELRIAWGLTGSTSAAVYRWDGRLVLLRMGESVGLVFPVGVLEAVTDR